MKSLLWNLFFLIFLLSPTTIFSQSSETPILIPFHDATITLDGKFDEPVWSTIPALPAMKENLTGKPARDKTTIKIWYNKENLYLGWRCEDKDIQATYTKHDSQLWDEEVVEFFIAPIKTIKFPGVIDYFEVQWNPLGTMFDALIHNTLKEDGWSKSMKGDWDWTAKGMRCAVTCQGTVAKSDDKDTAWQVEVILPFAALGQPTPKNGDMWRGNLFRYSRETGKPIEYQSIHPTLNPSFHQPKQFTTFQFIKQ